MTLGDKFVASNKDTSNNWLPVTTIASVADTSNETLATESAYQHLKVNIK
jgi:hypothetical protein